MSYRIAVFRALIDAGIPFAVYGKSLDTEGIRIAVPDRSLEKTFDDIPPMALPDCEAEGIRRAVDSSGFSV